MHPNLEDGHGNSVPTAVSDYVFSVIQDGILRGRIQPGSRLNQLSLAQELTVDQRTVREALGRLVARGLAVHTPHKGTHVITLDLAGVEEIYKIRSLLEPWAMAESAKRITQSDLDQMSQILPLTVGEGSTGGVDRAREANRRFHWIAITACGRTQLVRFLDQVWNLSLTYAVRGSISSAEKAQADSVDAEHHRNLVEALAARDCESAAAIAENHILTSWKHLAKRWEALHSSATE